ncbi:CVNH domain-containing protein [Podospora australis]|uniref:CVNH domain-containing protein n=1 Tax=Podospora australis TaxID=1536484 RepID=A0AAN7ADV2_9PEZI|nr:CVNH domain-containing protein [Podospora australis]
MSYNGGYNNPNYQNPMAQQQFQQDGPAGERGVLGAIGGGLAGGFGGNKIGNKTGHNKLGTVLGVVAGAIAGHKTQDGIEEWKDNRDEEKEKKKREEEEKKRREEEEKERKKREEEDRRRREEDEKRQKEQQHHSAPAPRSNTNYAGNFSGSARDIRLDEAGGEWRLTASCRRTDGSYQSSSISLNQILENNQGSFHWHSGSGCPPPRPHDHCGPSTVTVQSGDTLREIASRFPGQTWEQIARHNNISNPDLIYPGQVLRIPGGDAPHHGGPPSGGAGGNFGASARNVRLADGGRRLEADLLRNGGQYCNASIVLDERIGNENGTLKYKS